MMMVKSPCHCGLDPGYRLFCGGYVSVFVNAAVGRRLRWSVKSSMTRQTTELNVYIYIYIYATRQDMYRRVK